MHKVAIIGGGASGFFLGANLNGSISAHIFEKAKTPLLKVRVSGGGRCNLTHACFDPNILIDFYPRGNKELRGVFHRFMCGDAMQWFEQRGIKLKIEEDGRIFPVSDNSQDVVDVLVRENIKAGTKVHLSETVLDVERKGDKFLVKTNLGNYDYFDSVVFSSGSSKQIWKIIERLGHKIITPVPSLFSFNCQDLFLKNLPGTILKNIQVKIVGTPFSNEGDMLITHWGMSGPAILVLSAWAARDLMEKKYTFQIEVNFVGENSEDVYLHLSEYQKLNSGKGVGKNLPFDLTKKFWRGVLFYLGISEDKKYANLSQSEMKKIADFLTSKKFQIEGKSTNKDEFVTAGGVDLKEINFKNMESKIIPNVFFTGETLDIDAVTGGFNFQACWSEASILSDYLNNL